MDDNQYAMKESGSRLKIARETIQCSQQELADEIALDKSAISHWERGRSFVPPNKIDAVARKLGVSPEWILFGVGPGPGDRPLQPGFSSPMAPDHFGMMKMMPYDTGPKDLAVYGSAQGGFDGEEVDIAYPIAHIPRPSQLIGAAKAFGVYVVGSSMEPRYFPGEIVLCSPGKPIKKGDFTVIELADHRAIVKQFMSANDHEVRLRQLNPEIEKKLARRDVIGIHRIVGTWSEG